jgi:uncharacterized protein
VSGGRAPFREFILKINSACNLACSYCYMYESVDPVPAGAVRMMASATVTRVGYRIAEHAATHGLDSVRIVLHGGEPLLSGPARLVEIVDELRRSIGPAIAIEFTLQTNAVLLGEVMLDALRGAQVRIGVSLDGGRAVNDRHRLFRDGRSSYSKVMSALTLLRRYPDTYAGLLSVISVESDPVGVYEALLAQAPPAIDLLLPHGNWTHPPALRPPDETTPYGDWLIPVFDRWYSSGTTVKVRLFEEILGGLLGGGSRSETVGLSPVVVLVIDAGGGMEQADALRTTAPGVRETGLDVFSHPFDAALAHEQVIARQSGLSALAPGCVSCRFVRACGGGYYPHRFRAGEGFRNPSVYCPDLQRLIGHIEARIRADLAGIVRTDLHAHAQRRSG